MSPRKRTSLTGQLRSLLGFTAGAAAAWIVYSNKVINHDLVLPKAIPADRKTVVDPEVGLISYYEDTSASGRPLVLIHSINAAASAYEMRPLFERFRGRRPVYAVDLPGFGWSDRPHRKYTPGLYAQSIQLLLKHIGGQPADVVALSLGSEFAARAAVLNPKLFRSLALISPSGLGLRSDGSGSNKLSPPERSGRVHEILAAPLWARPLFDLIATRLSIHYFLQKSFVGRVDPGLEAYSYASSHQPGAQNAPLYFLSGGLFTPYAIDALYSRLSVPTLILFDQDAFVSFEGLPDLVRRNPKVQAERITPTLGLPQFEKLDDTASVLTKFWKGIQPTSPIAAITGRG